MSFAETGWYSTIAPNGVTDSRIIPHNTCQIPKNCHCKWLSVSSLAPGTSLGSSGSPGKFLFYMGRIVTTALPNLVPPRQNDDCYEIHFLHWVFLWSAVIKSPKCSALGTNCASTSFARSPRYLSSSRYRNLGPSESACRHYAYPNPVPLLLSTPLVIHEKNWKCLTRPLTTRSCLEMSSVLSWPAWCGLSTAAGIIFQPAVPLLCATAQWPRHLITQTSSQLHLVGRQSSLMGNGDCWALMMFIIIRRALCQTPGSQHGSFTCKNKTTVLCRHSVQKTCWKYAPSSRSSVPLHQWLVHFLPFFSTDASIRFKSWGSIERHRRFKSLCNHPAHRSLLVLGRSHPRVGFSNSNCQSLQNVRCHHRTRQIRRRVTQVKAASSVNCLAYSPQDDPSASVRPPLCSNFCSTGETSRSTRSSPSFPPRPAHRMMKMKMKIKTTKTTKTNTKLKTKTMTKTTMATTTKMNVRMKKAQAYMKVGIAAQCNFMAVLSWKISVRRSGIVAIRASISLDRVTQHGSYFVIVPRFTFFTEIFLICCNQITEIFRSGHDCVSASSARRPCHFRLQANITIWVLRKVRK